MHGCGDAGRGAGGMGRAGVPSDAASTATGASGVRQMREPSMTIAAANGSRNGNGNDSRRGEGGD